MVPALASAPFGWRDYVRMLSAGHIRLPLKYFCACHWFDLRYGTDTHRRLLKEDYAEQPTGFAEATYYQAAWTSEIDDAFNFLRAQLGPDFSRFTFVDIGCGKGKVVLRWTQLCQKHGLPAAAHGFDYYAPLVTIARRNHEKLWGTPGSLWVDNAATVDFAAYGPRLICFLYNPFGPALLSRMLAQLGGLDVILVYNNPTAHQEVLAAGFSLLRVKQGKWRSDSTHIYANRRSQPPGAMN